VVNAPNSSGGSNPKEANKVKPEAGYDFIEGSGFVIEGLEDKGLDAKSYIQQMLRRTDGSSREEQIIQKEQILAELQRVERELQEKAHAQMMLNNDDNTGQIRATEMLEDMVHLSLNNVAAAAAAAAASSAASSSVAAVAAVAGVGGAAGTPMIPGSTSTPPSGQAVLPPAVALATAAGNPSSAVRNVTNLANLPPSERPKAKPSRKIVNNQQNIAAAAANAGGSNGADKSKKCQLQAALQQHSQQLAQLQQLQQLNQ
jgi:hypothetical protein